MQLASAVTAGAQVTFTVNTVHSEALTPLPATITQDENQYVVFQDNVYYFSAYATDNQQTTVLLASSDIEANSNVEPTTVRGDQVAYGPYTGVDAAASEPLTVHFRSNTPFPVATMHVKEVEVSHWGNVAVEESIELEHRGAELRGSFSRFDFQRAPVGVASAVITSLDALLPLDAADIYYRDLIGNISTSTVHVNSGQLKVSMAPRFPMYGGWKNSFYYGYNLPLATSLARDTADSSHFVLSFPFGSAINSIVAEQFELRVILPEGATDITLHAPFDVDSEEMSLRKTYLDTTGRPMLVVKKSNVVGDHAQPIHVSYRFTTTALLHEPFLIFVVIFLFLSAFIVYTRIDLSLAPRETAEQQLVKKALFELKQAKEALDGKYTELDDAADRLLKTRGVDAFQGVKKSVEAGLKSGLNALVKAAAAVEEADKAVAGKVKDIVRLEKERATKAADMAAQHLRVASSGNVSASDKTSYNDAVNKLTIAFRKVDEDIAKVTAELCGTL